MGDGVAGGHGRRRTREDDKSDGGGFGAGVNAFSEIPVPARLLTAVRCAAPLLLLPALAVKGSGSGSGVRGGVWSVQSQEAQWRGPKVIWSRAKRMVTSLCRNHGMPRTIG